MKNKSKRKVKGHHCHLLLFRYVFLIIRPWVRQVWRINVKFEFFWCLRTQMELSQGPGLTFTFTIFPAQLDSCQTVLTWVGNIKGFKLTVQKKEYITKVISPFEIQGIKTSLSCQVSWPVKTINKLFYGWI